MNDVLLSVQSAKPVKGKDIIWLVTCHLSLDWNRDRKLDESEVSALRQVKWEV